jgi:hypothetical protein
MLLRCLQQVAIEWIQLIVTSLGSDGVANYLGSIAALLAIAIGLQKLGFAGPRGSAMIRTIAILAFAVWFSHAVIAKQTLAERTTNEVKQCLQDFLSPLPPVSTSTLVDERRKSR